MNETSLEAYLNKYGALTCRGEGVSVEPLRRRDLRGGRAGDVNRAA